MMKLKIMTKKVNNIIILLVQASQGSLLAGVGATRIRKLQAERPLKVWAPCGVRRYAIAYAVLRHLSARVDCRLLFATHYHPLTAEFGACARVALGHMAALVGAPPAGAARPGPLGSGGSGNSSDERLITFLYQLRPGACPRSYGLQVRAVTLRCMAALIMGPGMRV